MQGLQLSAHARLAFRWLMCGVLKSAPRWTSRVRNADRFLQRTRSACKVCRGRTRDNHATPSLTTIRPYIGNEFKLELCTKYASRG